DRHAGAVASRRGPPSSGRCSMVELLPWVGRAASSGRSSFSHRSVHPLPWVGRATSCSASITSWSAGSASTRRRGTRIALGRLAPHRIPYGWECAPCGCSPSGPQCCRCSPFRYPPTEAAHASLLVGQEQHSFARLAASLLCLERSAPIPKRPGGTDYGME